MDPLRYPNVKYFKSKVSSVRFKNVLSAVFVGVGPRCIGTYNTQNPPGSDAPAGDYLSQVAVDVINAEAVATTAINAVASVTLPAKVGIAEHVKLQIFVKVDIVYSG